MTTIKENQRIKYAKKYLKNQWFETFPFKTYWTQPCHTLETKTLSILLFAFSFDLYHVKLLPIKGISVSFISSMN